MTWQFTLRAKVFRGLHKPGSEQHLPIPIDGHARRQGIRPLRKPLIVMSPKSLLRHKDAISSLEELSDGHFHNVLDDHEVEKKSKITRFSSIHDISHGIKLRRTSRFR